jgi:hypothetical protein
VGQRPGPRSEVWWKVLTPYVREARTEEGSQALFENFEWYAGINAELNRRAGLPTVDDAFLARGLEGQITSAQNLLRVEQALRTVIVASPEAKRAARQHHPRRPGQAEA